MSLDELVRLMAKQHSQLREMDEREGTKRAARHVQLYASSPCFELIQSYRDLIERYWALRREELS